MCVYRSCNEANTLCPMSDFLGLRHQVGIILLFMLVKLSAIYDKILVCTSICGYFCIVT